MSTFWAAFTAAWLGVLLAVDLACKLSGRATLSATARGWGVRWPLVQLAYGCAAAALGWHFWHEG